MTTPTACAAQADGPAGRAGVQVAGAAWTDTVRNRTLQVRTYALAGPTDQPLPLVLLSPGFGEGNTAYESLARHWAEQGYLVLAVAHPGSDEGALGQQGRRAMMSPQIFTDRIADLRFVLDRAIALGVDVEGRRLRVDPGAIAGAGHSLGSSSALALAGLTVTIPGHPDAKLRDPRIAAVIAMSPQIGNANPALSMEAARLAKPNPERFGIHDGSWLDIRVPTMVLWGTRDGGISPVLRDDPGARRIVFERLAANPAYQVVIRDAEHHAFTDSDPWYPAGQRDPAHMACIRRITTAFLNAHLPGRRGGSARPAGDVPAPESAGPCTVTAKGQASVERPRGSARVAADARTEPGRYDFRPLDDLIQRSLPKLGAGAAVVLYRQGRLVHRKGYGNLTPESVVPIASASKWISGGVIMALVDQGLLSLDDTIGQHLPDAPADKRSITIRQLFSHTHGWAERPHIHRDARLTLKDAAERILAEPLSHPPGTALYYSGLGMQVAGRIAEVVAGKPWETIFREDIGDPLGMSSTDYAAFGATDNPNVAGSIRTSADDYARFTAMIANGGVFDGKRILSERAVRDMLTVQSGRVPILRHPWARLAERDPNIARAPYGIGAWLEEVDPITNVAWRASSGGAFGTQPFVDLHRELAGVFLANGRTLVKSPDGLAYNAAFETYLDMRPVLEAILEGTAPPASPAATPAVPETLTPGPGPGAPGESNRLAKSRFRLLDRNGDGAITKSELPERFVHLFDAFDQNGDGRVSEGEYLRGVDQWKGTDRGRRIRELSGNRNQGGISPGDTDETVPPTTLDIEPGAQQGGVRSADILVPDADRGLDLPVRVSFPSATGQYPLVILSHHAGGSRNAYEMLVRSWVARGYIVAQPSHRDAPERGGSRGAMARQAWEDRTRDVRLLVNGAAELERRIPALASKIDRRTAGVAGLYLGALSAELVAGLKMDGRDTMREQRVGAVILLSPQGRGNGKNPDAWSEIRVPMLVITGSGDNSRRTRQGAQWRTDAFHLSALGDKYLLWIEGLDARYGGLVGGDPAGPANAGAREAVLRTTALFWDAHLKGDHDAGVALIGTDAVKTR